MVSFSFIAVLDSSFNLGRSFPSFFAMSFTSFVLQLSRTKERSQKTSGLDSCVVSSAEEGDANLGAEAASARARRSLPSTSDVASGSLVILWR